jgi:hypothetical protein
MLLGLLPIHRVGHGRFRMRGSVVIRAGPCFTPFRGEGEGGSKASRPRPSDMLSFGRSHKFSLTHGLAAQALVAGAHGI